MPVGDFDVLPTGNSPMALPLRSLGAPLRCQLSYDTAKVINVFQYCITFG